MFVNRLWITELPKTAHHFPPYHIGNRLETRSFEAVIFFSFLGMKKYFLKSNNKVAVVY